MAASLVRNIRLCAKSTKKVLAVRVSVVNQVRVYGIDASLAWENRGCIFLIYFLWCKLHIISKSGRRESNIV